MAASSLWYNLGMKSILALTVDVNRKIVKPNKGESFHAFHMFSFCRRVVWLRLCVR